MSSNSETKNIIKHSDDDDDKPIDLAALRKTDLYLDLPKEIDKDELNLWIAEQIKKNGQEEDDEVDTWTGYYEDVEYFQAVRYKDAYYESESQSNEEVESESDEEVESEIDEEVEITNIGTVDSTENTRYDNDSSESGFRTQS